MFKKKPNIKSLAPLQSSQRRNLADQIIADLGLLPRSDEESLDGPVAVDPNNQDQLTALRNTLLPKNVLSGKFSIPSAQDTDEFRKEVKGTVYVGAWRDGDQRVLWFQEGKGQLVPTVYTLWSNPNLLPLVQAPPLIIPKLRSGDKLMTPGLFGGPPFPSSAKLGALISISSLDAPELPLIIGRCEIDISALGKVQGLKGVAVHCLTWSGDEVWAWSEKGTGGIQPEDIEIQPWKSQQTSSSLSDDVNSALNTSLSNSTAKIDLQDGQEADSSSNDPLEDSTEVSWNTETVSAAFKQSFLYAIYDHIKKNKPPHYGLTFPITQSVVLSKLITPYLPPHSPKDSKSLHIKKTSWGNPRKFLKALQEDGLVSIKDGKDEATVIDVKFGDVRFVDFTPYKLVAKKEKQTQPNPSTTSFSSDPALGQKLEVSLIYKAKEKLSSILDTKIYHEAEAIKKRLTAYVEREGLADPSNGRFVKLNPVIAGYITDKNCPDYPTVIAKCSIPRNALATVVMSLCSPYHTILRLPAASSDANTKPKAGFPPNIQITLETRSGTKTVTKVSGLEPYYINPQPLADELRKLCAGSANTERATGSSDKNPVTEVVVQGSQSDIIIKSLEKRGINKKWIEINDKLKGKKKR